MNANLASLTFALITLVSISGQARNEAVGNAPAVRGDLQSAARLPHCVEDAGQIKSIQDTISANSSTDFKYNGYRTALSSDTDTELMARLIYSETSAANCPDENAKIAPLIADVIGNRVRRKQGDVKSVVFQRNQFASSLNQYTESRFRDFLCPKDAELWKNSLQTAREEIASSSPLNLGSGTTQYFLYKHSPKWTKEPWKLDQDLAVSDSGVTNCVKFFKNPGWK